MFKFRLQRVLELREKREQAQALELAKAEEAATAARQQRDTLQELHTASRQQLSTAHQADPTVGHLHHLGFVLNALDERLGHAAQSVTTAEGVVSTARVSLEVAARDRRVLDRLKDKHEDAHRVVESHRDRVTMDEIALARFTRQREANQTGNATASPDATSNPAAPRGASPKTSARVPEA